MYKIVSLFPLTSSHQEEIYDAFKGFGGASIDVKPPGIINLWEILLPGAVILYISKGIVDGYLKEIGAQIAKNNISSISCLYQAGCSEKAIWYQHGRKEPTLAVPSPIASSEESPEVDVAPASGPASPPLQIELSVGSSFRPSFIFPSGLTAAQLAQATRAMHDKSLLIMQIYEDFQKQWRVKSADPRRYLGDEKMIPTRLAAGMSAMQTSFMSSHLYDVESEMWISVG